MNIKDNVTFSDENNTNIIVLEEINEDIRIREEPIGGFKKDFDKIYLIYKYRDNYEPIFMNLFEEYLPLINPYNIREKYEDTVKNSKKINNTFESIHDFIKNIVESLKVLLVDGKKKEYKQLPSGLEMIEIMKRCELPILSCVYDDYGFARYIETKDNCLIPIKPTSLESFDIDMKYILLYKGRSSYSNAINILKKIDKEINKEIHLGYLDKINVNVIEYYNKENVKGKTVSKHGYYIKEVVINETSFIPVEKILYRKRDHYDILYKGELYEIDSYISKGIEMIDKMKDSLIIKNYKDELMKSISRNIYIIFLKNKGLQKDIETIKSLEFMRNYHRIKKYTVLLINISEIFVFLKMKNMMIV